MAYIYDKSHEPTNFDMGSPDYPIALSDLASNNKLYKESHIDDTSYG